MNRRGSFRLRDSVGEQVGPLGRKARAIVAYLGTYTDERIGRDRLLELLWADRGEEQARGSLRQSLFEIRRVAPDLLSSDYHHVWIESGRLCLEESAPELQTAVLFADLNGVTQEFDDWLRSERAKESSEEWSVLERKVEALLREERGADALPLIERMQLLDPYNEDCLRLSLRAEAQAGHPAGIQRRFGEFAEKLKQDLDVGPAVETRELRDRLLRELTVERPTTGESQIASTANTSPADKEVVPVRRGRWPVVAGSAAMLSALGLTQSATSTAAPLPSVAVLPFEAVGIEPALADGFSDELLTQLVRNRGLRVVGRTAFEDLSMTPAGLKTFKRDLGVEYIVEGKVAPDRDRLRVLVSLVRTKDAKTMWAETFVGSTNRLQSIQASVGNAVGRSLSSSVPPFAQRTTSGEAYKLYLRAKGSVRDRNLDGYRLAAELLSAALEADPKFSAAWSLLAANTVLAGETKFPDPTNPGVTLTPVQGARRALDLNPQLAEAHAAMALALRMETAAARAHINRALALEPNDPQTLYWAGNAAAFTGDFSLANRFSRRSASLDPLWNRPVIAAGTAAINAGDPEAARHYLSIIKRGNPRGATEVEIAYRYAEADFSSAAAIATRDWAWNTSWDAGKNRAKLALIGIGFRSTPFGPHTPVGRAISFGRIPDRSWLVEQVSDWSADGSDDFYSIFFWGLAREGRWSDIAAIYDKQVGAMRQLTDGDPGGRLGRITFGGITALSLKKVGRGVEAVKIALATEEAIKFAFAHGEVPAEVLASIAQDEAVLGNREAALAHLEQAYAKGWRMFQDTARYMDPAEDPTFATLRGDLRFERINRLIGEYKAKERREYLAFMNQPSWRDR